MNILVCVKQVPDASEIRLDPETGTLIRAGVPAILNSLDAYALETALRLREAAGGCVTVLSMGPAQAQAALRECLAMGADKAVLVSDRAFGGSDTLATSYILATAIRKLGGFDLIFCGKQATDGDTAQTGPELAEHLGLALVTSAVDTEFPEGRLIVRRECEDGYERVAPRLPALITVTKTPFEPRLPTLKRKMAARTVEIPVITASDADFDREKIGLSGSPTRVVRTHVPARTKRCVMISAESAAESAAGAADALLRRLEDDGVRLVRSEGGERQP